MGLTLFGCEKEGETSTGTVTDSETDPTTEGATESSPITMGTETIGDSQSTGITTADGSTTITTDSTTVMTSATSNDTWDADAVSYAGPDENEWIRSSGTTK